MARILVEFLEVAITSVVFLKGVYPPGAFERRRYMNVVVQKARHPQLREYIHSSVTGLIPFIQKGLVERVAIIFYNTENVPLERFIFKLFVNQSYGAKVEEADLEFSLRSFLIKLPLSETLTKVLPRGKWQVLNFLTQSLNEVCHYSSLYFVTQNVPNFSSKFALCCEMKIIHRCLICQS